MTAAQINALVAQSAPGVVTIPNGTHDITAPIWLRSGVTISGESPTGCVLIMAPETHGPAFTKHDGDYLYRWGLRNLTIDFALRGQPSADPTDIGIDLHGPGGAWNFAVENVDINWARAAWSATFEVFMGSLSRVIARDCRNGFRHVTGTTMRFCNCFAGAAGAPESDQGWYLAGLQGCVLDACAMDGYRGTDPFTALGCEGLAINGFDAEVNRPAGGALFRFHRSRATWNGGAFPHNDLGDGAAVRVEGGHLALNGLSLPGPLHLTEDASVQASACHVPACRHESSETAVFSACTGCSSNYEVWAPNPNLRLRFPDGVAALRLHSLKGQITVIDAALPVAYRDIEGNDVLWMSHGDVMVKALAGRGRRPVWVDQDGWLQVSQ